MLFFQVILSAGYVYAHLLASRLSGRTQGILHLALLIAAICMLPVTPGDAWKPAAGDNPVPAILLLLTATVGLPYFVLSSTGPLLQAWFVRAIPGKIPYRLYALSNVGSLLALLSYPFVFETQFTTGAQGSLWLFSFVAFAVICGTCAVIVAMRPEPVADDSTTESNDTPAVRPAIKDMLLWFTLAAVPSTMLLATTNQVCTDVASVPFLWVFPLSLYLLTFILCFDSDRWYSRRVFGLAFVACVAFTSFLLLDTAFKANFVVAILPRAGTYFALLFCCGMVCHGELVQMRPHPKYLTTFYLAMSFGGAAGGLFVGLVAPQMFTTLAELPVAMIAACVLLLTVMYRDESSKWYRGQAVPQWILATLGLLILTGVTYEQARRQTQYSMAMSRNFYGTLRVDAFASSVSLKHGHIHHGHQFRDAKRRRLPTAYFTKNSGVGVVLGQHKTDVARNVGVIGLGAGTLATYGRPGESWRFYEINPDVVTMAQEYFRYLSECEADLEVVTADARIALEREEPQNFDVLVLDAFAGDAIPAHLLTKECGELYMTHLKEDGILAMHITNRHLDLRPVCRGLAKEFGLESMCMFSEANPDTATTAALWFVMSRRKESLASLQRTQTWTVEPGIRTVLWTDQWSNLMSVMGREEMRLQDQGTAEHITSIEVARP